MRKCLSATLQAQLPSCLHLRNTEFHFPISRFYFLFCYVCWISVDVTVKKSACWDRDNYSNNTINFCLMWNPFFTVISRPSPPPHEPFSFQTAPYRSLWSHVTRRHLNIFMLKFMLLCFISFFDIWKENWYMAYRYSYFLLFVLRAAVYEIIWFQTYEKSLVEVKYYDFTSSPVSRNKFPFSYRDCWNCDFNRFVNTRMGATEKLKWY